MSKIWVVGESVYKTESGFNEAINFQKKWRKDVKYKIYEIVEEGTVERLIEQRERDYKLKSVLGEIPEKELKLKEDVKALNSLILEIFNSKKNDPSMKYTGWTISELNRHSDNAKKFIRVLLSRKNDLFKLSNSKEYFIALLKVYNFRVISAKLDDSYHEAFKQAKLEIKSK